MYAKLIILRVKPDLISGGAESVTIGFFDEKGILQLEVPRVSGRLFPSDVRKGQSVDFLKSADVLKFAKT